ncbi:hypothetical protein [Thiothrix unzii]|jgi:hypothetical protein|uniref:hypothetical protein n=1 Tax=Thiothrix unzii TaxID=111769 RepID=UPI002A367AE0|nr:hypothetical protein [Thiothrix unzii]MDX9989186.1 hypothetical protein [Thiothrix unzii]
MFDKILQYFTPKIEQLFNAWSGLSENWKVTAFTVLVPIILGLIAWVYKNITKDKYEKFSEHMESEAYGKCLSLIKEMREINNLIEIFNPRIIGGFNVHNRFKERESYKKDKNAQTIIIKKMRELLDTRINLIERRIKIESLLTDLQSLGFSVAQSKKNLLEKIIEDTMLIEGYISIYNGFSHSYYDEENTKGMKYTDHLIMNKEDISDHLIKKLDEIKEKLYDQHKSITHHFQQIKYNDSIKKICKKT